MARCVAEACADARAGLTHHQAHATPRVHGIGQDLRFRCQWAAGIVPGQPRHVGRHRHLLFSTQSERAAPGKAVGWLTPARRRLVVFPACHSLSASRESRTRSHRTFGRLASACSSWRWATTPSSPRSQHVRFLRHPLRARSFLPPLRRGRSHCIFAPSSVRSCSHSGRGRRGRNARRARSRCGRRLGRWLLGPALDGRGQRHSRARPGNVVRRDPRIHDGMVRCRVNGQAAWCMRGG